MDREVKEIQRDDDGMDWRALLLLPVAFILGWFANDALTFNPDEQRGAQPGIGGGPPAEETPSPSPEELPTESPVETPLPESPSPSPSPSVQ